jgi:DNA recombination protein RmuC
MTASTFIAASLGLLLGILLGLLVGVVVGRQLMKAAATARIARAELASQESAARLAEARRGHDLLRAELDERATVESLLEPLRATLHDVETQLRAAERDDAAGRAALHEQIDAVRRASDGLRHETSVLASALRAPHVRGRWGEQQLERIVELAGMVKHCDFETQSTVRGADGDGDIRPDLVVHLAGGKQIAVDAKVPFAAYLEATEAPAAADGASTVSDAERAQRRAAHARQLRQHITGLSARAYWDRLDPSPEFVVLFVPSEAFLVLALEEDPGLLEYGFTRNVVVATPATLIALLRTVAYTWRTEAVADSAREVLALGRRLYERVSTAGEHLSGLGSALTSAVSAYNRTVASIESRLLVTARQLGDLGVSDVPLASPQQVTDLPRPLAAPELLPAGDVVTLRRGGHDGVADTGREKGVR